jgi:hypothetical protein
MNIMESDTNDYIESNPAYKKELLSRIAEVEKNENIVSISINEL